ncbi:ATP-binding cassette domain-containing protein [Shewanella intestini]|uniref:ABC transporter ATP-binding protein n=1 Tax=Shewanella intestini TaxID=2017544 RepID=A0ABS5I1M7_9GAMM|nr:MULTISPECIES: ABC transporter ATP-binding protein [Shewanella]MBR9727315.1 ABC transporter ATP-binding protein [Shewanella intestini]MRG35635.1 ATP-binding cassette domain-containing protein [Shewanella sp. XMDDZSB0408]
MQLASLSQIDFQFNDRQGKVFNQLNLTVNQGECHCIDGPTGSGKSTILKLLTQPQAFNYDGEVKLAPSLLIGLVMQDPNIQILRQTIGAEVAFGLENLAVPAQQMPQKVATALTRVGLNLPFSTPISQLSLGQKYRLMIAAQLVLSPQLLLLDEPWAQLDDQGVAELSALLVSLLADKMSLIIIEHQPQAFNPLIDFHWQLTGGQLISYSSPEPVTPAASIKGFNQAPLPPQAASITSAHASVKPPQTVSHSPLLTIAPHHFGYLAQEPLFECARPLSVSATEMVLLTGSNGAGKSSLLTAIVGGNSDVDLAAIELFGQRPKLGIFKHRLGFLMQRPSRQLFEPTVISELQFSLKRFGLPLTQADTVLAQLELSHLKHASPHTLSYGQQHLIAFASIACTYPAFLLLDDPFAGLDDEYMKKLIKILIELNQQGCGILIASHRVIPSLSYQQHWHISHGQLTQQTRPTNTHAQAFPYAD